MNTYTLMTKLRKARRKFCLKSGPQALYYELMSICNDEEWPDVFKCSNGDLFGPIQCGEKSLIEWRDKLCEAGLIQYTSGQANHEPCVYSLNGSINGDTNGSKNYSSSYSRKVEKTTDLNKTKRETKTNFLEVEVLEARETEINEAIENFLKPEEEIQKNVAPKKDFLKWDEAMPFLIQMAHWRNVAEHHEIDELGRGALFKLFYEQKEDNYRVRYPTFKDMAQNFYFWVGIHKNKEKLQQLNEHAITDSNTKHSTTGNFKGLNQSKRNELENLRDGSEEYLRGVDGL